MGLASFATVSMLGMGEVARRIVGIAYYNEKTDEVCYILHCSPRFTSLPLWFWGKIDQIIQLQLYFYQHIYIVCIPQVRISHVTFWGRRADKLFRREDILTLSEVNEDSSKFLWRIHFHDRCVCAI